MPRFFAESGLPALEELFEVGLFQGYGAGPAVGTEIRFFGTQPLPHELHGVVGAEVLPRAYGRGAGVMYPYGGEVVHPAGKRFPQEVQT